MEETVMNLLNALLGTFINVGSNISITTTAGITFTGEIVEFRSPVPPVPPPPTVPPITDFQIILLKLSTTTLPYAANQVVAIPASQIVSIG